MTGEELLDIFLDCLKDSAIVFLIALAFHIILSFFEDRFAKSLDKHQNIGPLMGSSVGLIPQCGISVVASDMYVKRHITLGTLMAVFIACSDEALPIMFSSLDKIGYAFLLLGIKFVVALGVGYLVDFILRQNRKHVLEHQKHCHHKEQIHLGCCHHEIDNLEENKWHKHLLHPVLHSLKIFAYVFVIMFLFGLLIGFIGEDNFKGFIESNKYLSPLYTTIIGLIPNCASSVLITELYVSSNISFGALVSGLIINAGLGLFYLIKNDKNKKQVLLIVLVLFLISLLVGYLTCLIAGF